MFRHSQATYVGQLEGRAARKELASTYERIWHDTFVNGRRNYTMANGDGSHGLGRLFAQGFNRTRDLEFRPELSAPRSRPPRANPFYAVSAEDLHTPRDPTDPNYFSDPESERTASVAAEYKAAERAERAASGFYEDTSAQQVVAKKENRSRSSTRKDGKLAQEQRQTPSTEREMAGRGRGRPGGNLKGITWEYDPSIKLESKPIELFPVRVTPVKLLKFLTLPSLIQTSRDQHPSRTKRREKLASTSVCRVKSTEVHSTLSLQSVMQLHQQRLLARTNSTVNTARIPRLILILSLVWRHTRRGCNRKSTRFPSCLVVHSVHLPRQLILP